MGAGEIDGGRFRERLTTPLWTECAPVLSSHFIRDGSALAIGAESVLRPERTYAISANACAENIRACNNARVAMRWD